MAKIDPNAWMATFADLLNLLITFFVMLLAMSSMDNKKLKDFMGFFSGAYGVLNKSQQMKSSNIGAVESRQDAQGFSSTSTQRTSSGVLSGSSIQAESVDERGDHANARKKHLSIAGRQTKLVAGEEIGWKSFSKKVLSTIHNDQMRHYLQVRKTPDGYVVQMQGYHPFFKNSSRFKPGVLATLKRLGYLARICDCFVHIKGGFDKDERIVDEENPTLYHLGAKRAVATTYLFQKEGVSGYFLYPEVKPSGNGVQLSFYFESLGR